MTEARNEQASHESDRSRRVPRLVLLGPKEEPGILDKFPGRFIIRHCETQQQLDSILLAGRADLLILDCRKELPSAILSDVVRREDVADFLAVGLPKGKKTVPSWMRSHWCPWPVDTRSFYRLVVALSRKAVWVRAYKELKRDIAHLQEEAALGRHLAQVLHELNNPLDAVTRFVDLASRDGVSEKARSHLDNASSGLRRMHSALGDLLRASRVSASRLRHESLREMIREAAVSAGMVTGPVEFSVYIGPKDHQVPQALLPIIINLLKNAQRACGSKGSVIVQASRAQGTLSISVTDDGEGFGELFAEELFKPWFSTHHEEDGLGLGLYAARNAVEQLGGRLEAHSQGLGSGATFTIMLPMPEEKDHLEAEA